MHRTLDFELSVANTPADLAEFAAALQSPEFHHTELRNVAGRILVVAMSGPDPTEQLRGVFADDEARQLCEAAGKMPERSYS